MTDETSHPPPPHHHTPIPSLVGMMREERDMGDLAHLRGALECFPTLSPYQIEFIRTVMCYYSLHPPFTPPLRLSKEVSLDVRDFIHPPRQQLEIVANNMAKIEALAIYTAAYLCSIERAEVKVTCTSKRQSWMLMLNVKRRLHSLREKGWVYDITRDAGATSPMVS